jgi:hypothetical protein
MPVANLLVVVAAVGLAGCALMSEREHAKHAAVVGNRLLASGFRALPADTPAKKAHLETMPKLLFSSVVRDGKRRYVLADPYRCHCVYVGDEAAYQRYTDLEIAQEIGSSRTRNEEVMREKDQGIDSLGPYDADVVWPSGTAP